MAKTLSKNFRVLRWVQLTHVMSNPDADSREEDDQCHGSEDGVEMVVGAMAVHTWASSQRKVTDAVGHTGQVRLVRGHTWNIALTAVIHVIWGQGVVVFVIVNWVRDGWTDGDSRQMDRWWRDTCSRQQANAAQHVSRDRNCLLDLQFHASHTVNNQTIVYPANIMTFTIGSGMVIFVVYNGVIQKMFSKGVQILCQKILTYFGGSFVTMHSDVTDIYRYMNHLVVS